MRYLILSDIHANGEALRAVRSHVRRKRYDRLVFLGDAVGYGASPNQVMAWVRGLDQDAVLVRGNHDRVCAGIDSAEYFNRYARQATEWTREHLEDRHLALLEGLPTGPVELSPELAVCHGSPVDEDAYIFSAYEARLAFDAVPHRVVFFGHTHVPSMFMLTDAAAGGELKARMLSGRRVVVDLDPTTRYLVNPGSVGQPRDRDPRAAYAIYDDDCDRVYLYRVSYRAAAARRRIIQAGLPPVLGDRLLYGA